MKFDKTIEEIYKNTILNEEKTNFSFLTPKELNGLYEFYDRSELNSILEKNWVALIDMNDGNEYDLWIEKSKEELKKEIIHFFKRWDSSYPRRDPEKVKIKIIYNNKLIKQLIFNVDLNIKEELNF